MTLYTSAKPGTTLTLKPGAWRTVAVATIPTGAQVHSMLYANVSGKATAGAKVVQVDVRALRDGHPEGHPAFDETALQTYTAAVKPDGSWRCRITATWFGGDPGSSMHWQIMPTLNISTATVSGTRYAKGMTN